MNVSTIVFAAIVLFFLWQGYRKGFIGSLSRIAGWIIAYPAAIFLTKPLASIIFKYTSLDGLMVYFAAGGIIFFLVSFIVSRLLILFSERIPEHRFTHIGSKAGGAIIGVFMGGFVGLLVGYAINFASSPDVIEVHTLPASTQASADDEASNEAETNDTVNIEYPPEQKPEVDSFIEASAKKMVGRIAETAIDLSIKDKSTATLTKAIAQNPKVMMKHMKQLSNGGEIQQLLANPDIQELLAYEDIDALLDHPEFQDMMDNEDMQAILAYSIEPDSGKTSHQLAAETLVKAWHRTEAIKNDPRVLAIIADPKFQEQVNASNKLPLLNNPQLKQLTEIIFSDKPLKKARNTYDETTNEKINVLIKHNEHDEVIEPRKAANESKNLKSGTVIYKWTDENGKVHFSDKPVE